MSNAPIISGARAQQALLVRASFAGLWALAHLCGLALCFSVCLFARGWGGTVYILSMCLCVCVCVLAVLAQGVAWRARTCRSFFDSVQLAEGVAGEPSVQDLLGGCLVWVAPGGGAGPVAVAVCGNGGLGRALRDVDGGGRAASGASAGWCESSR